MFSDFCHDARSVRVGRRQRAEEAGNERRAHGRRRAPARAASRGDRAHPRRRGRGAVTMEWTERFDGRVAIVTGGAAGIGHATARAFAACGATVVIVDVDDARLASAAAELGVDSLRVDVTREEEVVAMVRDVVARHGRIDILVNLAGIYPTAA